MEEKKGLSKSFWFVTLGVSCVLIIFIVIGFAFFTKSKRPVVEKTENAGNVVLNFSGDFSGLKIKKAIPLADAVGMKSLKEGEYFDFSVDVALDNATYIDYEISVLRDANFSTISNDDIKIYLEQEKSGAYVMVFGPDKYTPLKGATEIGTPEGSMVLFKTRKTKSLTDRYRLRIWVSDKSLISGGSYGVEVFVNAKTQ